MAYREPRLRVQQSFEAAPSTGPTPLYALLLGVKYNLHRFGVESDTFLAQYNAAVGVSGAWPGRTSGSTVDQDTVKVYNSNGLVRYMPYVGSAVDSPRVRLLATNGNRVYSSAAPTGDGLVFKSNGASYPRSAIFGNRDVRAGDMVDLTWSGGSLRTRVSAVEADRAIGTYNDPTRVRGAGDTTAGATAGTRLPASRLGVSYNVAGYVGIADGYPEDTYQVHILNYVEASGSNGPFEGTHLQLTSTGGELATVILGSATWVSASSRYEINLGSRGAVMYITDRNYIVADGGTAQAGAASTVTLAATASDQDDTYDGMTVTVVSGTGAGQSRTVASYVGSTRVATVSAAWDTNPDNTSVYEVRTATLEGAAQAGSGISTIILAATTYGADNVFIGDTITLPETSQVRTIIAYDESTNTATVNNMWSTVPATSADYEITATSARTGELWDVLIAQDYTEIDVTDAGDILIDAANALVGYTGLKNSQYQFSVVRGGTVGTDPIRLSVITSNQADIRTIIDIAAGVVGSAVYAIGQRGLQLTVFQNTQFNAGDLITVDVTAPSDTWNRTLVLANSVPKTLSSTEDMYVSLYTQATVQVPDSALTMAADTVSVSAELAVDSTLLGGTQSMRVFEGEIHADYREQDPGGSNDLLAISSETARRELLGVADQRNPIGYATRLALTESEGTRVYAVILEDDTEASYQDALDLITDNDELYSVVGLTSDEAVKQMLFQHVLERSNDINNQWRICWLTNDTDVEQAIYTENTQSEDLVAETVEVYGAPDSDIRKVTASNALFNTSDTVVGDYLRVNMQGDEYDEYPITDVGGDYVLIDAPSLPATSVSQQVAVWRHLTKAQYATAIGQYPSRYNERRVSVVWADNPVDVATGEVLPKYFLLAALAGQLSAVAPHAPRTRMPLRSVTLDPVVKFSRDDMNTMAAGGNWLVVKDHRGVTFTRHGITSVTDPDDLDRREQSKTTNLDSISREMYAATQDLFGGGNVSPEMLSLLGSRVQSKIDVIRSREYPARIGPQMLDASIIRLERDAVLRDSVLIEIDPALPDPLNELTIRFRVGVAAAE